MEPVTHPNLRTDHQEWNESYYFVFYDKQNSLGGMTRIGFKPNKEEYMSDKGRRICDKIEKAYQELGIDKQEFCEKARNYQDLLSELADESLYTSVLLMDGENLEDSRLFSLIQHRYDENDLKDLDQLKQKHTENVRKEDQCSKAYFELLEPVYNKLLTLGESRDDLIR